MKNYKNLEYFQTPSLNMHAQLYPRKYENSIFALHSIEYNVESCSHEYEGMKRTKTKLSEIQYTSSEWNIFAHEFQFESWPWNWAEWVLRMYLNKSWNFKLWFLWRIPFIHWAHFVFLFMIYQAYNVSSSFCTK